MARTSSGRSTLADVKLSCQRIFRSGSVPARETLPHGHELHQRHSRQESADVCEPGDVPARDLRFAHGSNAAEELDEEPVDEQKGRRNIDSCEKDENENQSFISYAVFCLK